MARLLQLETFDMPATAAGPAETEEQRLAAYEQGYRAGWDDAVAAQGDEIGRLRGDLGRNLADMALSYRDARRHVLATIEPLLEEMVARVLPAAARHSLGAIILDELRPAAGQLAAEPVAVRTAPANRDLVERLLAETMPGTADLPLTVIADDTLDEGQALIKTGTRETSIDLGRTVAAIDAAVRAFFHSQQETD